MEDEKAYFIEFRSAEGWITNSFSGSGRDFVPNTLEHEWTRFRVLGTNKNKCLNEMITKLKSLKD